MAQHLAGCSMLGYKTAKMYNEDLYTWCDTLAIWSECEQDSGIVSDVTCYYCLAGKKDYLEKEVAKQVKVLVDRLTELSDIKETV